MRFYYPVCGAFFFLLIVFAFMDAKKKDEEKINNFKTLQHRCMFLYGTLACSNVVTPFGYCRICTFDCGSKVHSCGST